MKVVLIRHGQTAGNLAGRYIGRTDEPLSTWGASHVHTLGEFPDVTCVFVSPMLRARQTSALLFPHAEQIVCDDLREMDFGDFEGKSAADMENDVLYRSWVESGCVDSCPNGESMAIFESRICLGFDRIVRGIRHKDGAADLAGEAVINGAADENPLIIVAHGGTLMALMYAYARPARDYFDWHVKNGQGWQAFLDQEKWDAKPALTSYKRIEVLDL